VTSVPLLIGEMRWLAAHALAALRRTLELDIPVVLDDAVAPLDSTALSAAAEAAGVRLQGGVEGLLATYTELAQRGALAKTRLVLGPDSR
jgi:hypothetical protein